MSDPHFAGTAICKQHSGGDARDPARIRFARARDSDGYRREAGLGLRSVPSSIVSVGCAAARQRDLSSMRFEIIGKIENQETFAAGKGIRELARLEKAYGKGRWRKRKGVAQVKLANGSIVRAELH